MNTGIFISGTDTGVGKTTIACHLIVALETHGVTVAVRKPVESGCSEDTHGLVAADAVSLATASVSNPQPTQVCRYRYRAVTSPARAAMLEGETLHIAQLVDCCRSEAQLTVVEGAGGLLSPIATDGLNVDLIEALGFAVIVVAADRLGSINHILLVLEALASRGLKVIAVVLNRMHPQSYTPDLDNYHELKAWVDVPIIQVTKDNIAPVLRSELIALITKEALID